MRPRIPTPTLLAVPLICKVSVVQIITSAMLNIFGRAGAILLAVVDVSHALFA